MARRQVAVTFSLFPHPYTTTLVNILTSVHSAYIQFGTSTERDQAIHSPSRGIDIHNHMAMSSRLQNGLSI